jgi:hypothetical protein
MTPRVSVPRYLVLRMGSARLRLLTRSWARGQRDGVKLSERMRASLWDQTAFIILIILVTVTAIDTLSRVIRGRFIGKRSL